jgi:predicted acyltransferase
MSGEMLGSREATRHRSATGATRSHRPRARSCVARAADGPPRRLRSLDVFRGLTMAAMVLVNNPGNSSRAYPALRHAEWNGWTPADLVFPFFLFIMGVAMAVSFARRRQDGATGVALGRVVRRGLLLCVLGLLLNGFPWVLGDLRVLGVLQRIGLAYILASLVVLRLTPRRQRITAGAVLLGYWAAIALLPVPGVGAAAMTSQHSLPGWLDATLLGTRHLYGQGTYDPEGLPSTLPAVVTVLFGYWAGEWLRTSAHVRATALRLLVSGGALAALGLAWGAIFPINKRLWTSSFVLLTAGLAAVVLALCFWAADVGRWHRLARPFEVMGVNAIFAYVASEVGRDVLVYSRRPGGVSARDYLYAHLAPWAGSANASLLLALGILAWWWMVLFVMDRRRWFLKI